MTLRVVFLGSPGFAVPALNKLVEDERTLVPLVVTQPDRPAGRGRKLSPPPIKRAAIHCSLGYIQPDSLRETTVIEQIRRARPDLLLVIAYGEILNREMLELAPHGALNVHPSLLPRFRGSSPVRAAILAGERYSGVSVIKLVRRLDAGPIVARRKIKLSGAERADSLSDHLATVAAEMLPDVLNAWTHQELPVQDQAEELATYTREWSRDDAAIDWLCTAIHIERLVRASQSWPVAWTTHRGQPFKIHTSTLVDGQRGDAMPGLVYRTGNQIVAVTGEGLLELATVQPAGKNVMHARDWWNGVQASEVQLGID